MVMKISTTQIKQKKLVLKNMAKQVLQKQKNC